jgi:serine/threonine-protein kinase
MSKPTEASAPKLSELKYQVTSVLGSGEGTTVVEVVDRRGGGGRYALKVIKRGEDGNTSAIERAKAECAASAKCGHPAILKCHDFRVLRSWFRVDRAELLMEEVQGKSLAALEGLAVGPATLAFAHTAAALAHMHRRGVLHGDLRPPKVMISRAGQVKVRGYGLSLVPLQLRLQLKPNGHYAAPEQTKEHVLDARTDIYNLGATMYHVLTGRPAVGGVVARDEGGKIPKPNVLNPKIPSHLNELVMTCLQTNPNRRPPDMYEVVKRLEAMVKEQGLEQSALAGLAADPS